MSAARALRLVDESGRSDVVEWGSAAETLERQDGDRIRLRTSEGVVVDALAILEQARPGTPHTAEVVVEGWRFVFTIEDEERAALRERAGRGGTAIGRHDELVVRSVIPGRVVSVAVAEGDVVEAGDRLLVVEAMKMQNDIRAPHGGIVVRIGASVGASVGATVEIGSVLAVLR